MVLEIPSVLAFLILLVEVVRERLAIAGQLKDRHELSGVVNRLERKAFFVFVNEVYGGDLELDNVPP